MALYEQAGPVEHDRGLIFENRSKIGPFWTPFFLGVLRLKFGLSVLVVVVVPLSNVTVLCVPRAIGKHVTGLSSCSSSCVIIGLSTRDRSPPHIIITTRHHLQPRERAKPHSLTRKNKKKLGN